MPTAVRLIWIRVNAFNESSLMDYTKIAYIQITVKNSFVPCMYIDCLVNLLNAGVIYH